LSYGVFRPGPPIRQYQLRPNRFIPTKTAPSWTPVGSTKAYAGVLNFGSAPGGNYAETSLFEDASIQATDAVEAWLAGPQPGASYDPQGIDFPMRGGFIFPQIRVVAEITPGVGFKVIGISYSRITGNWGVSVACNINVFS
jgi:hypothetical protein